MIDWTASMQQTFEYYIVDPNTWKDVKLINDVTSCSISWDSEADTLGSATLEVGSELNECYVRIYLVIIQNGVQYKETLGTFIVQSQPASFNGRRKSISVDAYTPLLELKEKKPPIGYYVPKNTNIMTNVYMSTRENLRAPVVKPECEENLYSDFVADTDDDWLKFLKDLMANAKYKFDIDKEGRILFSPKQDLDALQPIWTYDDSNSSILYPDINTNKDLYGIPNVVEVLYSSGTGYIYSRKVNDDPNSPTSTINRGREILHRVTDPEIVGMDSSEVSDEAQKRIDEYAETLLKELSSVEVTISYKHGYCPVRVGDCIRLNYSRADLVGIKAKVISQTISCKPGCEVSEKAVLPIKFWR